MATNNINFKLSSQFDGEGFKRATQAIEANKKELNALNGGLGEVSSAFKSLSPAAEKAVSGVESFVKAFVTGGIIGGTVSLALDGVSFAIKKAGEFAAETKRAIDNLRTAISDCFISLLGDSEVRFNNILDKLSQITAQAKDLANVLNSNEAAETAAKLHNLYIERLQAVTDDLTEAGKALVNAQYDLKEAEVRAAQKHTEAVNAQSAAVAAYENALKAQEEAARYVAKLDASLAVTKINSGEKSKAYAAVLEKSKNAHAALDNATLNVTKAQNQLEMASNKLTIVEHENEVQRIRLGQAIVKCEDGLKKEAVQIEENNLKIKIAANAEALAREETASKMEEFIKGEWKRQQEATAKLAAAQEKAADDINNGETAKSGGRNGNNIAEVKVKNVREFPGFGGMEVKSNRDMADIPKPKKLDDATWERFQKGTANVADIERVKRFAEMERRFKINDYNRVAADATKWASKLDKPDSWLSDRDKQFMETFKTEILPKVPEDIALELLSNASKHALIREDLKDMMQDSAKMSTYLSTLKDKVDFAGVENRLDAQTNMLKASLTVH